LAYILAYAVKSSFEAGSGDESPIDTNLPF